MYATVVVGLRAPRTLPSYFKFIPMEKLAFKCLEVFEVFRNESLV